MHCFLLSLHLVFPQKDTTRSSESCKTEDIVLNQKAFSGCIKGAICVPSGDCRNYVVKTSKQVHNLKRKRALPHTQERSGFIFL